MILDYYSTGIHPTQTAIADWAVGGANVGNFTSGERGSQKGVDLVLGHFGDIGTTYFGRTLTKDEIAKEIDGDRPIYLSVGWYKKTLIFFDKRRGGHAMILSGFDAGTSLATVLDPWKDNGTITMTYDTLVEGEASSVAE